ncbi:phospholipid/cholesterol/gamma-HCH transport system ATP-binding protein [Abditibacterium utsteinense]|uniref:Phospholipid/cholesterol/gamma-HCH transport system ATP-binding protein n=1 Tax=Abditibacterium utsteinense TaxID=1960156 RepID=A0A2S8SQE6_9BACT|nr:ATP-binding cassette domain-containing protein [Abditibacterium utsteinense]PQV63016.1 phospholipid/cholesterol/gamma-HCH transport system ATP-binding protein [Abditibacterium utsteinense]
MSTPIIELRNVNYFITAPDGEKRAILNDISFSIEAGSITCLMGTSGSGKTTLLRLMAGLICPESGEVLIEGHDICRLKEAQLNKIRRDMGFVFQYSALFDSLSVAKNIGFALDRQRRPQKEIRPVVTRLLQEVGLSGLENKRPSELSGGMKKRVAMARALASNPKIVLYDEPDSGLDPIMTRVIDDLILKLRLEKQTTNVVVSHNVASIWRIADRVLMLNEAQIVADGSPAELEKSENPTVRQFIEGRADGPILVR